MAAWTHAARVEAPARRSAAPGPRRAPLGAAARALPAASSGSACSRVLLVGRRRAQRRRPAAEHADRELGQQRLELEAENALLESKVSSTLARPRIERRRGRSSGSSPPADRRTSSSAASGDRRGLVNRRIRLLFVVLALALRRDARARASGSRACARSRSRWRGAAAADGRAARPARHDLRPQRRSARARRAGDDGLRRPDAGAATARGRARRRAGPRRRRGEDLPGARGPQRRFVYLQRKADRRKADALRARELAGVGFYRRSGAAIRRARRGAGARLRGRRQPRARGARALARRALLAGGPAARP